MDIGQTITIGRNHSNEIVIDNMAVSGVHAQIESVSATFVVTDLESTNGTFVNEKLVSSHGLKNNDVIVIGKHSLLFDRSDMEQRSSSMGEGGPEDTKTRYLDTTEYRDLINKATGQAQKQPQQEGEQTSQEGDDGALSKLLKKIFG